MTELSPTDALRQLLVQYQPRHLIVHGADALAVAQEWQQHHPDTLVQTVSAAMTETNDSSMADLALLSELPDRGSKMAGQVTLGRLRNRFAKRVAVLTDLPDDWTFRELVALGMQRASRFANTALALYTYDIETYNRKRSWNSPEHWANPQNWNKYRW